MHDLAEKVLAGSVRAAARACRLVDDRSDAYRAVLRDIYPQCGEIPDRDRDQRVHALGQVEGEAGDEHEGELEQQAGAGEIRGHPLAGRFSRGRLR